MNEAKLDNLNRQIMMYQARGYYCLTKDDKTYTAIMEKKGKQSLLAHFLVFIFFGWWLLFVPNLLLYFYYKKVDTISVFG